MASSAFRSATKGKTPLAKSSTSGDDGGYSSSAARRSAPRRHRSLSRFSHRRMPDPDAEVTPARKGKFSNTVRGSEFSEISLDDLAIEFFDSFSADSSGISSGERGRSGSRKFDGGGDGDSRVSQRRGRSVSRAAALYGGGVVGRLTADTESSKRRQSVSRPPARRDGYGKRSGNSELRRRSVSRPPARSNAVYNGGDAANSRRTSVSRQPVRGNFGGSGCTNSRRRRSLSVVRCRISDSESLSSAITDDEGKDIHSGKQGDERIIRAVYAHNKGENLIGDYVTCCELYEATRKELRNAVEATTKSWKSSDACHAIASVTKDYSTKLQESEERKRDLLAEILFEDQRGKKLSKIVNELLNGSSSEVSQKPSRTRKRSKDGCKILTCETDEADKCIEEFLSNIEDTDFSSLDDERSETSSSFGMTKTVSSRGAAAPKCVPDETDGVLLPWLQWETSSDSSSLPYISNSLPSPITKSRIWESDSTEDTSCGQEMSVCSISSGRGSWSPCLSAAKSSNKTISRGQVSSRMKIDVSDYLKRPSVSDFLCQSWKLRHRIDSGSLVLRSRLLF